VDVVVGDLRRVGDPHRGGVGPDLLLGEPLERLLVLPHVGDLQSVLGLGDPVEDAVGSARARALEAHPVDDLVVLLERGSLELHDYGDGHGTAPLVG
jgi:hypothetical protein